MYHFCSKEAHIKLVCKAFNALNFFLISSAFVKPPDFSYTKVFSVYANLKNKKEKRIIKRFKIWLQHLI